MKKPLLCLALCCTLPLVLISSSLPYSAWERQVQSSSGDLTEVLLIAGNYFSWSAYESNSGAFLWTKGGAWHSSGNQTTLTIEFNTADSTQVGVSQSWEIKVKGNQLHFNSGSTHTTWSASTAANQPELTGAFLFAGRKGSDQTISRRDTNQPRKTLKLLAGGHFQWIAYNTETKQFFGTGGGIYKAQNGKYTEVIRFFSRDIKRVGAELNFDFTLVEGEWHHSGKSSSGEPMYEIWAPRE